MRKKNKNKNLAADQKKPDTDQNEFSSDSENETGEELLVSTAKIPLDEDDLPTDKTHGVFINCSSKRSLSDKEDILSATHFTKSKEPDAALATESSYEIDEFRLKMFRGKPYIQVVENKLGEGLVGQEDQHQKWIEEHVIAKIDGLIRLQENIRKLGFPSVVVSYNNKKAMDDKGPSRGKKTPLAASEQEKTNILIAFLECKAIKFRFNIPKNNLHSFIILIDAAFAQRIEHYKEKELRLTRAFGKRDAADDNQHFEHRRNIYVALAAADAKRTAARPGPGPSVEPSDDSQSTKITAIRQNMHDLSVVINNLDKDIYPADCKKIKLHIHAENNAAIARKLSSLNKHNKQAQNERFLEFLKGNIKNILLPNGYTADFSYTLNSDDTGRFVGITVEVFPSKFVLIAQYEQQIVDLTEQLDEMMTQSESAAPVSPSRSSLSGPFAGKGSPAVSGMFSRATCRTSSSSSSSSSSASSASSATHSEQFQS